MANVIDNKTLVQQRYSSLPTEIKELIDFGLVDRVVSALREQHRLNQERTILLENEIYLVLLLFLPFAEFADRLEEQLGIENDQAEAIKATVHDEIIDLAPETFLFIENWFAKHAAESPEQVDEDDQNTPRASVAPIRTMPTDFKRAHGYGAGLPPEEPTYSSSQDDVVQRKDSDPSFPST